MKGIWRKMISRCYKAGDSGFPEYGARGIYVCERWRDSYSAFVADIGPRPSLLHSLDRRDNSDGYTPENCRWATKQEQQRNRRTNRIIRVNDCDMTVTEASELYGVNASQLTWRLDNGWDEQSAATTPLRNYAAQPKTSPCPRGHYKQGENALPKARGVGCRICNLMAQRKRRNAEVSR